jgi:hypothetical protein
VHKLFGYAHIPQRDEEAWLGSSGITEGSVSPEGALPPTSLYLTETPARDIKIGDQAHNGREGTMSEFGSHRREESSSPGVDAHTVLMGLEIRFTVKASGAFYAGNLQYLRPRWIEVVGSSRTP